MDENSNAALAALGIALVCDMRADTERHYRPIEHDAYRRAQLITCSIESSNADLWSKLEEPATSIKDVRQTMIEVYRRLPMEQSDIVRDLIAGVAEGRTPVLFHCAAGKDRTGFAAAVLLAMLGVPDETIIEDYRLTESWITGQRDRFLRKKREEGKDDAIWQPLFTCDAAYLLTALDTIREEAGGIEAWLVRIGITPQQIDAARDHLLEAR